MISTVVSLPLALLLLALLARQIRIYYALNAFGGHWSAGWSRLWLLRTQRSGVMNRRFTDINRKYGSTARIAPKMLITSDPEVIRRMNAVRSSFTRGRWYSALKLHPERDNITSHVDERVHTDLRARMAPGYSGKENVHMERDVDEQLLRLFDLLEGKYVARPDEGVCRTVDLARVTSYFTLDVISKIAFGQTFGFLDRDEDPYGYLDNLARFLPAVIVFGVYPELTELLKIPLLKAALPKSTDRRGLGRVMGFARTRVGERFGDKRVERRDMLGSFIKRGLGQEQLESETLTQITAGSDSTASALRVTLHFISTTPAVLTRLLREADDAIAASNVTRPVITDAEARRLPYLQACVKEGLRVYPPVTGLLAKQVPAEGAWIRVDGDGLAAADRFAPPGTQIGWNSWGMMRDAATFGADCEVFRPERWLARDGSRAERERVGRMNDTVALCFGYGRFGCLGRGVAVMELNKAVIETLLRYTLQPCSLARPFTEMVVGFYVHTDMHFVVTRRDATPTATALDGSVDFDGGALPGAYDE